MTHNNGHFVDGLLKIAQALGPIVLVTMLGTYKSHHLLEKIISVNLDMYILGI